ncbi:DUF4347 domain-containing protein [Nostoc sp. FACHB-973]|nr:DUF4347 domain-containing protein [Nostoc sp. FACHB-973]
MSATTPSASLSFKSCISILPDNLSVITEQFSLKPENVATGWDGPVGATSWLSGDVTAGGDGLIGTTSCLVGTPEHGDSLTHGTGSNGDRSIVFVDGAIGDVSSLLIGLAPGTEVVRLDAAQDGVEQIGAVLSQRQDVSAVHILSHGNQGLLQLGTTTLSADNLARYQATLQSWGTYLSADADILLYGCDVAEGAIGQTFVQNLANLTGADVAASVDLTGNASLGGDWDLEYHQGAIATVSLAARDFESVLAATVSFNNGALVYESTDSTSNQIKIYASQSYLAIEDSTGLTAGSNVSVTNNRVQVQTSSISSLQIKAGSGNDSISITNDISLNASVSIDGEGGDDSFNLDMYNGLNSSTQGNNLTVKAETINIGNDAIISTRKVSGNHLTDNSTGNSGKISFTGKTITLGSNSKLLSQVETGSNYTAGNIELIVSDTGSSNTATTGIYLNDSSILKGADITLRSTSDSSNTYDGFSEDNTVLENLEELVDGYFNTGVGFVDSTSLVIGVARANSNATINIGKNANIEASNLTINATSDTSATVDAFSLQLGLALAYGESNPTANINIDTNAKINATGNIDIDTNANSTLSITAAANSLGTFSGNSKYFFGMAGTNSTVKSTVNLASSAALNAGGNVTIDAKTDKDHSSSVSILGISKEGGYGLGINLSFADVTAQALVDGKVTASGSVGINAEALTTSNKVSSGVNVGEPDGFALSLIVKGIETLQKKITGKSAEQINQSQRGATGSFLYAQHDNTAVARIGTGATVKAGGTLDVTAKVTENPEFSSSSKSKVKVKNPDLDAKAASVAILLGDIDNTAKAYIGDNAIADAKGAMKVESKVDMPFDEDFTTAFTTLENPTANEITGVIFSHLKKDAGVSVLFSSWAKAKAYGNNVSFGASVNYLNIDNTSEAYIGENAQINQDLSYRSPGNQTVAVNAYGNSFTLNFAGDFNPLTELTTFIKNRFGIKSEVYDMLFGSGKVADKGVGIGPIKF